MITIASTLRREVRAALACATLLVGGLALTGCNDNPGATEQGDELPEGQVARIELSPSAVLLTEELEQQTLTVRAFDAGGREVRATGLELEWVNTAEAEIELAQLADHQASVARVAEVGSSVIVVRSGADPALLSNPVVVRAAVLHDEVVTLADEDIAFPPVEQQPGQELLDLPHFSAGDDGETYVGGFAVSELLIAVNTSADEESAGTRLRYPVVIRREAYVPGMQRVLGSGSSPVAGHVIAVEERGDWVALLVEAGAPGEIYESLDVEFDGQALVDQGLLDLERLSAAADPDGFREATAIPIALSTFNEDNCASGDFTGAKVTGLAPTIKPSVVAPQGAIKIDGFDLEYLRVYGGVLLEASIRPELDIQAMGELALNCYVGEEFGSTLGLSAFTASVLDLRYKHRPRVDMSVELAAGPRLNAYALLACNVKATAGVRYEDGQWHWSDGIVGDYNTFSAGCPGAEPQVSHNVTFTGLGLDDAGIDGYIDAQAGLMSENIMSMQLGGAVMERLQKVVAAGQKAQEFLDKIRERVERLQQTNPLFQLPANKYWDYDILVKGGQQATRVLQLISDLADIDFIEATWGPELRVRLESTRKILNEADATYWHANEHQVAGLQVPIEIEVGLTELDDWFKAMFPNSPAPATDLSVVPPPFDAVAFYKGIEGYGTITHRAYKAPGNTPNGYEIGDQLELKVPGVYGQVPLVDLSDGSDPTGAEVYWRSSLSEFSKAGELLYTGTEDGFLIFEGTITVEDQAFADHLNEVDAQGDHVNPLFFVSYNKLIALSVPGYLGSYTGYNLARIDVEGIPASSMATREVGESAEFGVALHNASDFGGAPMAVEMDIGALPGWLIVSQAQASIAADGDLDLTFTASCAQAGMFSHDVELTFRSFNEFDVLLAEKQYSSSVSLICEAPDSVEMPPPAFVGTACPAVGNQVDYAALDAELLTYQNPELLQFGLKLLPASGNVCLPANVLELPVPCGSHVDYELWKMGGSVSFNDFGLLGTPYFVWNPHYLAEGMWDHYGLISVEPITLLSYAQETAPLQPCNDARGDLMHGPTGPIIADSEHPKMIRAFPIHQRAEPLLSLPEGYQSCYDLVTIYGGNELVPCSEGSTSGALYLVAQPHLTVGNH